MVLTGLVDGTAPEYGDRGATAWREAVRVEQRAATDEHSAFYMLAGDASETLRAIGSLASLLARKVNRYDVGRDLYDDTGTLDVRERLDRAVVELQDLAAVLEKAGRHADRFHAEIGHIGGGPIECDDDPSAVPGDRR